MVDLNVAKSPFTLIRSDILKFNIINDPLKIRNEDDVSRQFGIDYKTEIIHTSDTQILGSLLLACGIDITQNDDTLLKIKINIRGIFSAPIEFTQEKFIQMLELNGITALYSILRGKVTSLSSLCCPEEIIDLPMININKLIQEKHKQNDNT